MKYYDYDFNKVSKSNIESAICFYNNLKCIRIRNMKERKKLVSISFQKKFEDIKDNAIKYYISNICLNFFLKNMTKALTKFKRYDIIILLKKRKLGHIDFIRRVHLVKQLGYFLHLYGVNNKIIEILKEYYDGNNHQNKKH